MIDPGDRTTAASEIERLFHRAACAADSLALVATHRKVSRSAEHKMPHGGVLDNCRMCAHLEIKLVVDGELPFVASDTDELPRSFYAQRVGKTQVSIYQVRL